jgi:hypothetical protein
VAIEGAPEELEFVLEKQIKEGTRNTLEGYDVVELRTGQVIGSEEKRRGARAGEEGDGGQGDGAGLIAEALTSEEVGRRGGTGGRGAGRGPRDEHAVDIDELMAQSSSFSVYDDVKAKLIAPASRRRGRVHPRLRHRREEEKAVRLDERRHIRVLMGSTFKMGAGMNVQERLVACTTWTRRGGRRTLSSARAASSARATSSTSATRTGSRSRSCATPRIRPTTRACGS